MATPSPPPSLLLLSAPPRPASRRRLAAAYRAPLTAVLTRLSHEHAQQEALGPAPVLVVAVVGSFIRAETGAETDAGARASRKPSSVRWKAAQSLLARLYAIVAYVCAERDIAAHLGSREPGSVDARVVLVHRSGPPEGQGLSARHAASNGTAVLDLAAFAAQMNPWAEIFHASNEPGCELLAAFLAHAKGGRASICGVDGGVAFSDAPLPDDEAQETEAPQQATEDGVRGYGTVCLGGTFDHLHPGHKLLLEAAVLLLAVPDAGAEPCNIVVGISGDALLTNKEHASELQPWEARARSVVAVLATTLGCVPATAAMPATTLRDGRVLVHCVDIGDPFGPTVTEERIGAIVVSGETRGGGDAINDRRAARGWAALDVYEIDVLDATGADDGGAGRLAAKISSTEIRRRQALGRDAEAAGAR